MTRDEALEWMAKLIGLLPVDPRGYITPDAAELSMYLRTYILNSIPTPKVEVVPWGKYHALSANGANVITLGNRGETEAAADALIAALQGGGE